MVTGLGRCLRQDKLAVAIRALDLGAGPHFEEHARMPKRATTAVTGDAVLVDYDDF